MVKNVLRTALFSLFILSYCACTVSPTYSRKDIETAIKNLCKQEFSIDVKVWEVGDTIWVYFPFEKIVNKEGTEFNEEFSGKMNNVILSLRRIILSMDKRPKFYTFVASDINAGFDLYFVWYVEDLVMLETGYISRGEFQERQGYLYAVDSKAIGNTQGDHIQRHNLTMGEFVSYLIRQNMESKFLAENMKDKFQINDLRAKYLEGKIEISFDIVVKKYEEGLLSPYDEALKSAKKYLKIYSYPQEITEIVITDTFNKKSRFYTINALREEN